MVFIQPRATGTCGAPEAALHRAAGAKKSSGALFSALLGSTVFIQPGAAVARDAPELPCTGRRVREPTRHVPTPELS
jgi:hypothetical protein